MWNKNHEVMVTLIGFVAFAVTLIIAGMMMGAMNMFTNLRGNACYNSYDDKEGYAECEALEIEDFTKKIVVKK